MVNKLSKPTFERYTPDSCKLFTWDLVILISVLLCRLDEMVKQGCLADVLGLLYYFGLQEIPFLKEV